MAPIVFAIRNSLFDLELAQRRLNARRVEWQVADALARCIGEGVDNRGSRGPLRGFARAQRTLVRTVDQLDFDARRFRHGKDWIARPVARADPALVEAHLLLQGPAHRLDDPAF